MSQHKLRGSANIDPVRKVAETRDARGIVVSGCELECPARLLSGSGVAAERGVILGELLVEVAVFHACLGGPREALLECRRSLVRAPERAQRFADRIAGDLARVGARIVTFTGGQGELECLECARRVARSVPRPAQVVVERPEPVANAGIV